MILINEKQVQKSFNKINDFNADEYSDFFDNFSAKQPNLFSYSISHGQHLSNEDVRHDLVYIIAVIWNCYSTLKIPLPKITKKEITIKEKEQLAIWTELANTEDPKKEEELSAKLISQPYLWTFMNDIISEDEDNEGGSSYTDEDTALIYACVNLIIELLSDKINKTTISN